MRVANQAITRERHPLPTVDDLIHTLNGATVFSKLDLRAGYHQVPLSPESRHITTFATHKGLWRYTQLNFGTNSASGIFQKTKQDQLQGIPGTLNISDDVIVYGKTQAEHDRALDVVCQKFSKASLTLNRKKCESNKSSVTFFGFVFSGKGVVPDPKKVQAIKSAPAPTTSSSVCSFLGMATYCAKFIPKFSDLSAPLRELTKRDEPFHWSTEQEYSFNEIKRLLTSAKVMRAHHRCISNRIVRNTSSKVHNLRWKASRCLHQPNTYPCRIAILTNWERSTRYCVASWEITCVLVW